MSQAPKKEVKAEQSGSSPVGRGGAGTYIEGQLGAYYLLQMLAGSDARGAPNARIERVQLQGENEGYALDDLIVHGISDKGTALLEIQSKRTIRFSPKDPIFRDVCEQIVRSNPAQKPTDRHLLAVATQRTSYSISGPYQDVLEWAHRAESGVQFFARLALPGVASEEMRSFAKAFRSHLVTHGVADEDEAVWAIIRRFMILEFDFESAAPEAKAHALTLARQVLAPDDATRAEALWSNLIEIVIETGKAGGSITRQALIERLTSRGFHLAGGQNFALSRAKLAEMSRHALSEIGTTVGGVNLPRLGALADLETARNKHRFIEITGKPGVGKSWVLRHLAERIGREGHVIVLDPVGTPDGGWSALAQRLDMRGTAKSFLWDLAASGGGILFIDGLEMFTSVERRRTVNDLLREIADVPSFSVVVSRRPDVDVEDTDWVAQDALAKLGTPCQVVVDELNDDEVEALSTAKRDDDFFRRSSKEAVIRVDNQGLARWVSLLRGDALPSWYGEIVDAYALWSARLNGHGYSADAEVNQTPDAWNHQFYSLVASAFMDATQDRFEWILQPIIELPDRSFCDVAETLIHAADVRYFNEANRPSDRAFALRQRLVTRTLALNRWSWDRRRGDFGIDIETGPTIGMLLMNLHNSFSGTKSYLVPAVFDRVDPLLQTVRPMMRGGPTAFIALCTMNTLNVAPTARHLDFLLFAVETWLEVTNGDRAMWNELGIGRKIAEWFEVAAADDPSLHRQAHPSRSRIDAILGRLVSLGVSEAHELELQIQAETR